jgi:predicted O-methyltransferase YrrM
MTQHIWSAIDSYFCETLVLQDEALLQALQDSDRAGLPQHHVAPNQGKLLHLLARMQGARKILEIGTLGGYSTIWLARALPQTGRLVSLEADARNVEVARANISRANLSDRVEIRLGKAIDTLPKLFVEGMAPFDFIFIDADKTNNPQYLDWSLKLSRPGTVIVCDNVVREGAVLNAQDTDPSVIGIRRCLELMAEEPRLSATAIQTVGAKGFDGFAIALVSSRP